MRLGRFGTALLHISFICITVSSLVNADSKYPLLRESFNQNLQSKLESTLVELHFTKAVERKQLSVVLVDVTKLESPEVAAVNGDHMIYAASLPKIAILLGAFVLVEKGQMVLDRETKSTLTSMIRISSNRAATTMLRRVGPRHLANILQSPRFKLYDPKVNGGLWCGKEYGKRGTWKRDPMYNLSHAATAMQTARFYYLLETGQLVSPALSKQMKAMLSDPGINHKFVRGLKDRPDARIYRKSGSWRHWHADSAIVEQSNYKYIAVALAEHPKGGTWMEQLIGLLHDLIVPKQLASVAQQ